MLRENEDLGGGDRVEPFLDPTPNCREERGRTNNLVLPLAVGSVVNRNEAVSQLTNIRSNVSG